MVGEEDKRIEIREYVKQLNKELNQAQETLNYIMELFNL